MRAAFCVTLILVCLITVAAHRSSSSQLFGYVTYSDNSAAKGVVVTVGDFNVATNDAGGGNDTLTLIGPMQGTQPAANAIPSPNAARGPRGMRARSTRRSR